MPSKSKTKMKSTNMKPDDIIRLKIMDALFDSNGAKPNIDHIVKKTGLSRRTVYLSLEFLKKNKVLSGYKPVIDTVKLGFPFRTACVMEADLRRKSNFEKIKKSANSNPKLFWFSDIIGASNYNLISMCICRSIEEHHKFLKENSSYAIYNSEFVGAKQILYLNTETTNLHKDIEPSKCAIKILMDELNSISE